MEIEHPGIVQYLTVIQALQHLGREVKKQSEHASLSASFSSCLSCPSMFPFFFGGENMDRQDGQDERHAILMAGVMFEWGVGGGVGESVSPPVLVIKSAMPGPRFYHAGA